MAFNRDPADYRTYNPANYTRKVSDDPLTAVEEWKHTIGILDESRATYSGHPRMKLPWTQLPYFRAVVVTAGLATVLVINRINNREKE